jgi:hypothetical protein
MNLNLNSIQVALYMKVQGTLYIYTFIYLFIKFQFCDREHLTKFSNVFQYFCEKNNNFYSKKITKVNFSKKIWNLMDTKKCQCDQKGCKPN